MEADLRGAEILFTISLRPEQFALCRQVRWIHAPTAALNQFQFPELINSDVVLTNSTEVHGPAVAEPVIAQISALAKKLPQIVVLRQKHVWGQEMVWNSGPHPREVAGATLGLVGVGSIGRRVAEMASAIGMRVIAVREHVEKGTPEGIEKVFPPTQIDELLRQSDFVVIAAQLIPATEKLINASCLRVMKPEAYLINVGRGPRVDESVLFDALRANRIAGAALDVFQHEPLPADSPLWDLDNLLITPHTAGLTDKLWHRHYDHFSGNLRRYLAREPLQYAVDKRKGY